MKGTVSLDEFVPRRELGKFTETEIRGAEYINDIFSCCISSAKAEKIILKETLKEKAIRAQLHTILIRPFGGNKTTEIFNIPKEYYVEMTDFTLPSLIGSITRDGQFVEGCITRAAGKTLIIDEFHNLRDKPKNAMLSMLDNQHYVRSLAYPARAKVTKNSKFKKVSVKAGTGEIRVGSRFSCICAGLNLPRKGINDIAWISRFMPIQMSSSFDDMYNELSGLNVFNVKPKPYIEQQVFEDYMTFLKRHREVANIFKHRPEYQFIKRNVGDFARLWAWKTATSKKSFDWEELISYVPLALRNYSKVQLSREEYLIVDLYRGHKQTEIAALLNIDRKTVTSLIERLKSKNFIATP